MMLRGGSAPLQIETGRWKGVPREERLCRECGMNQVEDCDHWLLLLILILILILVYIIDYDNFYYEYSKPRQQKDTNTVCHIKDEHPSSVQSVNK